MKFIQDRFETDVEVNGSKIHFCDAIVLPEAEYNKLSQANIDSQKAQRVSNFKHNLENPPKPVELTKEQELEQVNAELTQINEMIVKKETLEAKKVELEATVKPIEEEPLKDPVVIIGGK